MNDTKVIQALLLFKGIGRVTIQNLNNKLDAFDNLDETLKILLQINPKIQNQITLQKLIEKLKIVDEKNDEAIRQGIKILGIKEKSFPQRLKLIKSPPVILYYKGDLDFFELSNNIAIIGTRNPTLHGIKIAVRLGLQFAKRGCGIVSGLAIGCDTYAHKGCLDANGKALAVMPSGLDRVYPASNRNLASQILEYGGSLVSEYCPGTKPTKGFYIDRDRLQSAFSDAVVVVETDIKGGTMHTVNFSKKQNKILAAYKHPDSFVSEPKCQGNFKLLKEKSAIPIDSEASIIDIIKKASVNKVKVNTIISQPNRTEQQLNYFKELDGK